MRGKPRTVGRCVEGTFDLGRRIGRFVWLAGLAVLVTVFCPVPAQSTPLFTADAGIANGSIETTTPFEVERLYEDGSQGDIVPVKVTYKPGYFPHPTTLGLTAKMYTVQSGAGWIVGVGASDTEVHRTEIGAWTLAHQRYEYLDVSMDKTVLLSGYGTGWGVINRVTLMGTTVSGAADFVNHPRYSDTYISGLDGLVVPANTPIRFWNDGSGDGGLRFLNVAVLIPEPSSLVLLFLGTLGLFGAAATRRRRRSAC